MRPVLRICRVQTHIQSHFVAMRWVLNLRSWVRCAPCSNIRKSARRKVYTSLNRAWPDKNGIKYIRLSHNLPSPTFVMELQDVNIASPTPTEGPIHDVVIDTELSKTAKLEIEHVNDGLLRGEPSSCGRFSIRQYLIAGVCVCFGLIVCGIALSLASNPSSSTSLDKNGRSPDGDITKLFSCLATESSCPANATNDWIPVSHDIFGESGGDLAGYSASMSCDGSIMAIGAPGNRYIVFMMPSYLTHTNRLVSAMTLAMLGFTCLKRTVGTFLETKLWA
jgi:hypothetical protein